MADGPLWFAGGIVLGTFLVMLYYAWNPKGEDRTVIKDLAETRRALETARSDLSQCTRDKLQAIADCHHEMLYRDRDRRALTDAVDLLAAVKEFCADAGETVPTQYVIDLIEGRVHG